MDRSLDSILLTLGTAPRRVVSLIPSYTESLFQLGLGEYVVGVTDYCSDPADHLAGMPRVGGPKDARVADILRLQPDLVIANQEENSPATVAALEQAGVPVWLSFPKTVQGALDVLWGFVDLFSSQPASLQVRFLEDSFDWAARTADTFPSSRYFCPIWQGATAAGMPWWMTFNQDTYSSDLLGLFGGVNLFAGRKRRYPLEADLSLQPPEAEDERDTRYPCVGLAEILEKDPQLILLPDEPYRFDEAALEGVLATFRETSAVKSGRVHMIEGSLITWCGTRLSRALEELPAFFTV